MASESTDAGIANSATSRRALIQIAYSSAHIEIFFKLSEFNLGWETLVPSFSLIIFLTFLAGP
jgi:hypothetical protein